MYVSLFLFISPCFVTSIFQIFLVCCILFQSFSYISYLFHLLRNRNEFIKKKDVCFIVSFRFILFRNEHWISLLVCFILFQSFSYYLSHFICYETEMGFKKKKKMYVSSFHFVSPCFITSIFQIFWFVMPPPFSMGQGGGGGAYSITAVCTYICPIHPSVHPIPSVPYVTLLVSVRYLLKGLVYWFGILYTGI